MVSGSQWVSSYGDKLVPPVLISNFTHACVWLPLLGVKLSFMFVSKFVLIIQDSDSAQLNGNRSEKFGYYCFEIAVDEIKSALMVSKNEMKAAEDCCK